MQESWFFTKIFHVVSFCSVARPVVGHLVGQNKNINPYNLQLVDCRPADAVMELTQLLHSSSHSTLKQLLQPLLLPCLNTILSSAPDLSPAASSSRSAGSHQGSNTGPSTAADEFQTCGSAWVMLGMLRLHLAAPPAGADPVGKYAFKKAHLERRLAEDVLPETEVGSQEMLSHLYFIIADLGHVHSDSQGFNSNCWHQSTSLHRRMRYCMVSCQCSPCNG